MASPHPRRIGVATSSAVGTRPFVAGSVAATLAMILTLASAAAGPDDVSPALRARAFSLCTDDATSLCPSSLFDEGQALRCRPAHRLQLSRLRRGAYDQVPRLLRR